jgi:hypothetical protein
MVERISNGFKEKYLGKSNEIVIGDIVYLKEGFVEFDVLILEGIC